MALLALISTACTVTVYGSRGAVLTFFVGIACTAAALGLRRCLVVLAGAAAVLLVAAFLFELPLLLKFSHIMNDGRLSHWATAWTLFLEAPLLGHGLHTFIDTSLHPQGVPWAHNLYLQALAEQGVIGLVTLAPLLLYAIVTSWRARRLPMAEQRIVAAGALGALVGFCAASAVELTFVREWVILAIFILLALAARIPIARAGR